MKKLHTDYKMFVENLSEHEADLKLSDNNFKSILTGYLVAAIFTEEERLEEESDIEDIDFNIYNFCNMSRDKAMKDIKSFINDCPNGVVEAIDKNGAEQLGHDIWLTRNAHGAGFFDRNYVNEKELTNCADKLGEVHMYVNDGGELCFE